MKQKVEQIYLENEKILISPLHGKQIKALVHQILGIGTDFSAAYVKGKKQFSSAAQSTNAWYDHELRNLRGLSQYTSVDSIVLTATGNPENKPELTPETLISIAESMDISTYAPSRNWSKRHWNNLRMVRQGDSYSVELDGLEELKGIEGAAYSTNPYMQGDFHMTLLRQALSKL